MLMRCPRRKLPVVSLILAAITISAVAGLTSLAESNWVVRRSLLAFSEAKAGTDAVNTDFRAHNWAFAQRMFLQSPLSGRGLTAGFSEYGYEIHNSFLGAYAELGVVGGTAAVAMLLGVPMYAAARMLLRHSRALAHDQMLPLLLAVAGTVFFAGTHYVLRQRWVWLSIALMLLQIAEEHGGQRKKA